MIEEVSTQRQVGISADDPVVPCAAGEDAGRVLESSPEFDAVVSALGKDVRRSQMMGYPSITRDGKMIGCFDTHGLGVKLGRSTPEHAAALAVPGATIFTPGNSGRLFYDWVTLPPSASDTWTDWMRAAIDAADASAHEPR
ncbi:MAG: hypothetical protein ABIR17_00280 [Pseudolysinimonas sp.]|uniref:hypothetical protein n=1 Tax=Pseudolysinimonas sp. TaxID=2680009 RepID=UPI0032632FE0